jgi:hypothetical protein
MGMPTPDVDIKECSTFEEQPDSAQLACPTFGLQKFEEMHDMGLLEVGFSYGQTKIYRVVQ